MWWVTAAFALTPLTPIVEDFERAVATWTPASCSPVAEAWYSTLEALDPAQVDTADAAAHAEALVQSVVRTRGHLQDDLTRWDAAGTLPAACVTGIRRADLAGRYLVDHLTPLLPPERRAVWRTPTGDAFAPRAALRTGDVLVTRATWISSAGIAHMGRLDSQFSHNALVYSDPQGVLWVTEAYLERGAIVEPLETFLASGLGRVVVMRHADAALAEAAGTAAFQRVATGRPIPYDDHLDANDPDALFCSEIARWAYGALLGRPTDIPRFPTTFPRTENPGMFHAMAISGDLYTAPADLLFDPRFSLVAEWRDPQTLEAMRRDDAVVESAMRWLEEDGYTLDVRFVDRAVVTFGRSLRRAPLLGWLVADQISPHADLRFYSASLALQTAALALRDALTEALADWTAPTPPAYRELRATLEEIREDDLARWRVNPHTARFHGILRPPEAAGAR
jgi:hypothetical protein